MKVFKAVLRRLLVFLLGAAAGFAWLWHFDSTYLSHARDLDSVKKTVTLTANSYSVLTDYGSAVECDLELDGKSYRVYTYLDEGKNIAPGDLITGEFRFRVTTDGGEENPTYHRGNGIFLLAYQEDKITHTVETESDGYFPVKLRQKLMELLDAMFLEDTVGIARGLLLGDSSLIDYETDTALQLSGIRHIIAVSGLHVTILFGLVLLLGGKNRFLSLLLGIPTLVVFAAVVGFTPSITRACVMQVLLVLATVLSREYDSPTALALAVLVILGVNPVAITSVGFQLSVGSIVGILFFGTRIQSWLMDEKRFGRFPKGSLKKKAAAWVCASVSVSLGASLITVPLTALYFGNVSLISPLTNVLTLWVVMFIFYGILAACLTGFVWLPAGIFLGKLISWPIRYVVGLTKLLSKLPMAAVFTQSGYIVAWLVFSYVLLLVFCISRRKQPVQLICCAVLSLCVALGLSWAQPLMSECMVTVLDVGQGQCILLQSKGRTYMVDCGGSYFEDAADTAAATLLSQGISQLDGLVLTHYDADHAEGAVYLLQRIGADAVFMPDVADESGLKDAIIEQAVPGTVHLVQSDLLLSADGMALTIFGPEMDTSDNESSLCVLFQAGNCDILITGDRSTSGELALLQHAQLPDLEVLVAGHHGSKSSTGMLLLEATKPDIVLISVGADNWYGHPSPEMLARLEQYDCQVYRTDLNGTIIIRR